MKMNASARFKTEIWCMDLAYVDNLNDNKGVKYLLVHQDMFDGTVDSNRKRREDSN